MTERLLKPEQPCTDCPLLGRLAAGIALKELHYLRADGCTGPIGVSNTVVNCGGENGTILTAVISRRCGLTGYAPSAGTEPLVGESFSKFR